MCSNFKVQPSNEIRHTCFFVMLRCDRYEEWKKKGLVEESDEESSDDDDDEEEEDFSDPITIRKEDKDFFKALMRVRSRDPRLKEKDVKLFESDDDSTKEEEKSEQKEQKDKKAMYLKDVNAKHLIEEGPDFQEQHAVVQQKMKIKSYDEEQEEIKKALLDAEKEVDNEDDGDFLKLKEKRGKDDGEKEDFSDGEFSKRLEEYFGEDTKMDENTKFLKEFFKNKMWIDKEKKDGDLVIDDEVLRDEEEIERQEGYELEYNFRHEENGEDRVIGYSRTIEGSVRKKESKRKAQRERKEEESEGR
ncbi:hypothetical protein PTKIN_Ptkin16aG0065300 [Pterospermum kingtungense]